MLHNFFSKKTLTPKPKTLTPEQELEMVEYIDQIGKELFQNKTEYKLLKKFNLTIEKLNLKTLLNSLFWQSRLSAWQHHALVHYPNENDVLLPKGKVCITTRYDANGFPEYLKISYAGTYETRLFIIDLNKMAERAIIIKKNKFTYLGNIDQLLNQIKVLAHKLESANEEVRAKSINEFNQQWKNQLKMTFTVNAHDKTGFCIVQDLSGYTIDQVYLTSVKIDSPVNVLANPKQHSFWNKNLPCNIAKAAIVCATLTSAYVAITKV